MRILIPATATPGYSFGIVWPINRRDSAGYWHFWRTVWAQRQTIIVVEEDVVPSDEALEDLWRCEGHWCAQPYPHGDQDTYYGLGCVKFDALVMDEFPDLWQAVAELANTEHAPKDLRRLDFWSAGMLYEHGYERHHHTIPVDRLQSEMAVR
jgi:hypothetical protein